MISRVKAYLVQRRAFGYKLRIEGQMLVNYADRSGHKGPLTRAVALRWAALPHQADSLYRARRLEVVRVFAKHQAALEPGTEIPPRHILGVAHRRRAPHIYSPAQIRQLLRRAERLPGRLRSLSYQTLIGLLACTGLRISEALALKADDVDMAHGTLLIRDSKYHHSRLVPLHPTTLARLQCYARRRQKLFPGADQFFVSERGQLYAYTTVRSVFRELAFGIVSNAGRKTVRLHDLRHTFASRVLLRWQRSQRGAAGRLTHSVALPRARTSQRHLLVSHRSSRALSGSGSALQSTCPMNEPDLASLLPRFFTEHLVQQRNVSPCTVAAYRDTFRLLLRFLQRSRQITPSRLPLKALTAQSVLAFLSHLEKDRGNSIRSRNARLAAVRSFIHYASDLLGPDLPEQTRRVLAISSKRAVRPLLGFLTREEVEALLAAANGSWSARRDHLLFLLLYNTGARVSEILALRVADAAAGHGRHLFLHGKGRKERQVPLWSVTQQHLRHWIKENRLPADAPLLPNRFGERLSRSGVAWQLRQRILQAGQTMPSLTARRISPHTIRHTTAMHLLQSGVAPELIALWLGHESPETTHLYVEADLEMKRRTLENLAPPKTKQSRRRREDHLFRFLNAL
jgi:site-specific recombinase XerD